MKSDSDAFEIKGWQIRALHETDETAIQGLAERTSDYTEIVEGQPTKPGAGKEFLAAAPEGWLPSEVHKLGLYNAGHLHGIIEVAEDFPTLGIWYLGLLLLDPSYRGCGEGERIYRGFEAWARLSGAQNIVLSVVADNRRAQHFWRKVGFVETRTLPAQRMGLKFQERLEMEKRLLDERGDRHTK